MGNPSGSILMRTRWWVLGLVSLANLSGYYVYDSIAPVADLLHRQLGFSYEQIGTLNAIYSIPNIVIALFGGILADRYGAAVVGLWTAAICLLGAILTAVSGTFPLMAAGRLLFGIGGDALFVAMLVAVGRAFSGAQVSLALALFYSLARVGSYLSDVSPTLAKPLYDIGWQPPLMLAAAVAAVGLAAITLYWWLEKRTAPQTTAASRATSTWPSLRGLDRAFWYLLWMGAIFYGVVWAFRSTFSIEYFQNARGLSLQAAGVTNSWVFFSSIFATPLVGWIADQVGQPIKMLAAGMLALALSFAILGATAWPLWVSTALMGVSFSVVPTVLWPAVTKIVEFGRLGAAFGLMTILQNVGITVCNLAVGKLNDVAGAGRAHPAGYAPMIWFLFLLSFCGCALILRLWPGRARAAPASSAITGSGQG
jgi:MFS family permease